MRRAATILGLVVVLGSVYVVYQRSVTHGNLAPPQQQVDVIGIKSELLAIGQAERQYLVAHATYGTLDELLTEQLLTGGAEVRGYRLTVTIDAGRGFTATATPADPDKTGWPTFTMNETMQITER